MAEYEPLNPQVIGMQWPAIRQESIPFDLGTELGYTFAITGSAGAIDEPRVAQWALSHFPSGRMLGQTPFVSIYRRGDEANVGSIRRIIIPVESVVATGVSQVGGLLNTLDNPWDDRYYELQPGNSALVGELASASNYQNALQGRRILKLNMLYSASGAFNELDNETVGVYGALRSPSNVWGFGLGSVTGPLSQTNNTSVGRVNLGDVNPFWAGEDPYAQSDKYPWRWEEIDRMTQSGASPRFHIAIYGQNLPTLTNPIQVQYMALEVIYCEENRLWYGGNSMGRLFDPDTGTGSTGFDPFSETQKINLINLRTTSFQVTGALDPGDYSVTLTLADSGDTYNRGDKPNFAALRQVEALPEPGVQGVSVTKWQDPDGLPEVTSQGTDPSQYYFAGNLPTSASSDVFPGIGLYSTDSQTQLNQSAPHSYYLLHPAPVNDGLVVQQGVVNDSGGAEVYYPWVRFYARHLGDMSRTLRIRALSGLPAFATITQEEFDALPEIVDGWREVTLRLDSATPSFSDTGAVTQWEWDTINGSVTPQHRWEVAVAASVSLGSPATTYGRGITAFATYNDIYDAPTVENGAIGSDAVLMFSQDPIAVSGLAVEVVSQAVTGIGLECATIPECIPTGIAYHQVTWDAGEIVCDTFSRVVSGGWGEADTGQSYTSLGGANTSSNVDGETGAFIQAAATGSHRETLNGVTLSDPDMYVTFSINQSATAGASLTAGFTARGTDSLNQYVLSARCNANNTITALIERVVAGSFMTLASATVPNIQFFPDQIYEMRARLEGSLLQFRVWENGSDEPTVWHATATDATYTSGPVGLRSNVAAAYAGEYPVIFSFDNFAASEITVVGNTYELQRQDDVDDTWYTIMKSTDLCPTSFNDYEARVGVESRYRIRLVNALRFPGPWSDEVGSTLTAPGVFGSQDGNGVLIFTTNERQSGSSNLAYVMSWERSVSEEFDFPETGTVQLQPMYQRDYVVAFRPTERGGERFSRTLLVNNAAVPTGRIRDGFRSLRDMAWEDVPYVCVRNELGDRWLATVLVPSGNIQRNRRMYLARVDIVEVTDTPSEVSVTSMTET